MQDPDACDTAQIVACASPSFAQVRRAGSEFMWWGLSISLTKKGEEHVTDILRVVYQYLQVRREGGQVHRPGFK